MIHVLNALSVRASLLWSRSENYTSLMKVIEKGAFPIGALNEKFLRDYFAISDVCSAWITWCGILHLVTAQVTHAHHLTFPSAFTLPLMFFLLLL